jgi:hypothetical protein
MFCLTFSSRTASFDDVKDLLCCVTTFFCYYFNTSGYTSAASLSLWILKIWKLSHAFSCMHYHSKLFTGEVAKSHSPAMDDRL